MTEPAFNIEDLISLYHGHQAVAERSRPDQLKYLHVATQLDQAIQGWLNKGHDVVLTGNPGDGKTHLLDFLELPETYGVVRDASQRSTLEILQAWRQSRERQQPFLLAINHAPLRSLAHAARQDKVLEELAELVIPEKPNQSAIDNFIVYSGHQKLRFDPLKPPRIMIVDLSQREILTAEIVSSFLQRLYPIAMQASCSAALKEKCSRCPLHDNAQALAHPEVQRNVAYVLALVARRGFHATMRDILGLLAYALTAGVTCEQLWQTTKNEEWCVPEDYDFCNLLFRGRSPLFEALQRTFDPGQYSDPRIDMKLWAGQIREGWLIADHAPKQAPSTLDELKLQKRQYFFEHSDPVAAKAQRMRSSVEDDFDRLLVDSDAEAKRAQLVGLINLFYAPIPDIRLRNYQDRLYLWNQHRYSVGQPPGYTAMRSIAANRLAVYTPTINPWYAGAIEIHGDHVLLGTEDWEPGDPTLRVDWELFRALSDAKLGKAIEVQPYTILRRLDVFLRRLGQNVGGWSAVETVLWGDYQRQEVVELRVDRKQAAYDPT